MAIPMPDLTKQIAAKILATSNPQRVILYTPSSASVLNTPVNYNGGMARIRICAYLDSLPEVHAPVILPTDTLAQKEQKNAFFRSAPKKGLLAYLQNPVNNELFRVGAIDIYNIKPFFLTGVNEFFSDLYIYGIQFGWKIVLEVINRGYGMLETNSGKNQQDDRVDITGFCEEKSSFLQGSDDAIYNYIT